jgi:uncharacterized membrane protein YczE
MTRPIPSTTGPTSILIALPRLLAGLTLCGIGVAMMVVSDLGLGPWDVLHEGLAARLGIPIGVATIATGVVVLMLWLPLRERPGLGTLLNVTIVGLVLDTTLRVLATPPELWQRTLLLVLAVPLFAIGSGLYLGAGLGSGPRDGIMTGLARRGTPIGVARAGIEITALLAGWSLGGTVGIGTIYFALGIGPMVHLLLPRLRAPWYPAGSQPRVLGGAAG